MGFFKYISFSSCLTPLFAAAALSMIVSCSGFSHRGVDKVAMAEKAFACCDYSEAAVICDSLVATPDIGTLGVDRLCRLSMLCVRLAEAGAIEGEVATALAVRSFSAAVAADSDSVTAFLDCLTVEDRGRMMLVNSLSRSRMKPVDIREYSEESQL